MANVIKMYENQISKIVFEGPSYFFPILLKTIEIAESTEKNSYQILLLFTDGIINDMSDSVDTILLWKLLFYL